MPRVRFVLADSNAGRDVDCWAFSRDPAGAPACEALRHPWCLSAGRSPECCSFRLSRREYAAREAERKHQRKRGRNNGADT